VKVALIGAGSTVFARTLIGDLLSFPELADGLTIALMDIDADRLDASERIASMLAPDVNVEATLDRRTALADADYVLTMFQVGGYRPATVTDFEVPKRFGLRQTIGDTLGIGGIMRGLRTIPVLLDLCHDMEELCPDALLLQYVNPMAMLGWAVARASSVRTIGLCHSVQGTARDLAVDLGVDELDYRCAGINHLAFYLELTHRGRDVYPELKAKRDIPEWNRVRYEVLHHFGYFCTESSEHLAEYVPWFIKSARPELVDEFNVPLDEYLRRCEEQLARPSSAELTIARSDEYGAAIIHALETGTPFTFNGNVMNDGLIDNLPYGCVEVPCVAAAGGITPQPVGPLPPQLAALMRTNMNVQELTVEASLTGRRDHVYHAAMLDPHTAAELSLAEIHELVDQLLEAHGELVPALR
jgi:alpha-galactosidase